MGGSTQSRSAWVGFSRCWFQLLAALFQGRSGASLVSRKQKVATTSFICQGNLTYDPSPFAQGNKERGCKAHGGVVSPLPPRVATVFGYFSISCLDFPESGRFRSRRD
ncbi:hypothetical protein BX600DRAFT_455841, partial [Xylariales sp. PMI_506]